MSKTLKMAAGDMYTDDRGRSSDIYGIDKFAQDVAYYLMTEYDEDKDIGNELINTNVPISTGRNAAKGVIATMTRRCINRLDTHQSDIEYIVTDDERFSRIKSLTVKPYSGYPGSYAFLLQLEVVSGDTTLKAGVVDLTQQDIPEGLLETEILNIF